MIDVINLVLIVLLILWHLDTVAAVNRGFRAIERDIRRIKDGR